MLQNLHKRLLKMHTRGIMHKYGVPVKCETKNEKKRNEIYRNETNVNPTETKPKRNETKTKRNKNVKKQIEIKWRKMNSSSLIKMYM